MKNQKPQGSFGIPKEMLDAINEVERKKSSKQEHQPVKDVEDCADIEDIPEEKPKQEPKKQSQEKKTELTDQEKEAKLEEVLAEIKKDLKIEITEDDIWSMLFNNEIVKRGVTIVPGKMVATFKTLSFDDTNEVDSLMATELEKKRLENGFKNINTQYILSKGMIELGKPGNLKSLGETSEERFKAIGKMSSLVLEKLGRKWNTFVFLVDETLKKEMDSKKE